MYVIPSFDVIAVELTHVEIKERMALNDGMIFSSEMILLSLQNARSQ